MKSAKMKLIEVDVTPDMALEWLTANVNNRNVSRKHVAMLAELMTHGHFRFVGDPIRFDLDGRLLDGQHRLHAIIESETTQHMAIMVGLDPDSQLFMDTGRRRTAGDQLAVALGVKDANRAAAIARTYLMWRHDAFLSQTRTFTLPEIVDWAEANEASLHEATRVTRKLTTSRVPTSAPVSGAAYLAARELNQADAEIFWDRLADGASLDADNPILVLRNAITRRKQRDRWTQPEEFAFYARAWNTWRREGKLQRLQAWRGPLTRDNLRLR